jgi:hypothetical protein
MFSCSLENKTFLHCLIIRMKSGILTSRIVEHRASQINLENEETLPFIKNFIRANTRLYT